MFKKIAGVQLSLLTKEVQTGKTAVRVLEITTIEEKLHALLKVRQVILKAKLHVPMAQSVKNANSPANFNLK